MDKCILVIDDDPMNLGIASYVLEQNSYKVITATSGREGLDKLKENKVDLILLDIEMPGMNGIETFQNIQLYYIEIPVIFLTASGNKKDVMEVLMLGAEGYIKKPFVPDNLIERVKEVLLNNQ